MIDNSFIQSQVYNFARVKGAFGWRATVVFRLQVIATPFQAGRLRMAFSPFEDGSIYMPSRSEHITGVSQLPGVDLDIVEQTSCVLKVPFIHAYNYFLVKPRTPSSSEVLGTLSVFPYIGPNIAAGSTNPTYVLWMSLEDFELVGVAPFEYTAQMAPLGKGKASSSKEASAIPGNLSNVLAAGSNLMTWAGSRIPFLSSVAGPSSWALRQAANIDDALNVGRGAMAELATQIVENRLPRTVLDVCMEGLEMIRSNNREDPMTDTLIGYSRFVSTVSGLRIAAASFGRFVRDLLDEEDGNMDAMQARRRWREILSESPHINRRYGRFADVNLQDPDEWAQWING